MTRPCHTLRPSNKPEKGYRGIIGVYEVTKDIRIPFGTASANTQAGLGGGSQYYINKGSGALQLLKENSQEEFYNNYLPTLK